MTKTRILKILSLVLVAVMVLSMFASCGQQGEQGPQGEQGIQGEKGEKGDKGDTGMMGPQGIQGEQGLQGEKGDKGEDGADGADGLTPYIGRNGNWFIGETDTRVKAKGTEGEAPYIKNGLWYVDGENTGVRAEAQDGAKGDDGEDGKTGFFVYTADELEALYGIDNLSIIIMNPIYVTAEPNWGDACEIRNSDLINVVDGEIVTVLDPDDLADALGNASEGDVIALGAGTFDLPTTVAEGVTILGDGTTKVTVPVTEGWNRLYGEGVTFDGVVFDQKLQFNGAVTFKNCTFNGGSDNACPAAGETRFENCVFNAQMHFASGDGADVEGSKFVAVDCVFNGNLTLADFESATMTNCDFKGTNWAGTNMISYNSCTFNSCTFSLETGVRAASGMTASQFTFVGCSTTVTNLAG